MSLTNSQSKSTSLPVQQKSPLDIEQEEELDTLNSLNLQVTEFFNNFDFVYK